MKRIIFFAALFGCWGGGGTAAYGEAIIRRDEAKAGRPIVGADFLLTPRSEPPRTRTRDLTAVVDLSDLTRDAAFRLTAWGECTLAVAVPPPSDSRESAKEMIVDGRSGLWWSGSPDTRMQWYERSDGCFEWEVCLDSQPTSNIVSFPLHSTGLVFCYQGALTPEEIAEGGIRPDSVIGSYAVYHASGRDDRITIHGADTVIEQYGTGKAFHIYRPKAHDANGVTCWCDLELDGAFRIIVPRTFLSEAKYPVTIDPTFGYSGAGATQTIPGTAKANINDAHTHLAGAGETITSFTVYGSSGSGTQTLGLAAYTMNNNTPKLPVTRLAAAATVSMTGGSPLWYTTSAQTQALPSGTRYCVALGDGNSSTNIYYDSYGATARSNNSTAALTTTWTNGGTGTPVYSMYATYTVSAESVPIRRRRNLFTSITSELKGSEFHAPVQTGGGSLTDAARERMACNQRGNRGCQ